MDYVLVEGINQKSKKENKPGWIVIHLPLLYTLYLVT